MDEHHTDRRDFLKGIVIGSAALGGAAAGLFGNTDMSTSVFGVQKANAAEANLKMALILASVAAVFFVGFMVKSAILGL